jgi:hypothetical protein
MGKKVFNCYTKDRCNKKAKKRENHANIEDYNCLASDTKGCSFYSIGIL